MMNNGMDFLLWAKGPAFDIALIVFLAGILIRLLEIFMLGRKKDLSEPRAGEMKPGLRTMLSRSVVDNGTFKREPFPVIVGYVWHIGFFICLFLFVPHIELIKNLLGISWPGLPNPVVDAAAVITIAGLIAMLIHRMEHPVMSFLSQYEDYLVWTVTFLPVLTGYFAYHRLIDPYPIALGLHILTVDIFLIVFPFTKLMHAITAWIARWYTGAAMGRKGVQS